MRPALRGGQGRPADHQWLDPPVHGLPFRPHRVVHTLLSWGAKVNLLAEGGMSPLHEACYGGRTEVVHALLSAGAKVDLQTQDGSSPLHAACTNGHTEVVRALLSAGSKVDLLAKVGLMALPPCTWHASRATRRWYVPCYPGGPRSTCRLPKV